MIDGHVVIVPTDTTADINRTEAYDVLTMRKGVVSTWYNTTVDVDVYNQNTGNIETINISKENVCIIENPLYSVMNEYNSTLQRLIKKLSLLDDTDERMYSGKLDLIIQLPYLIKTDVKKQQADERRLEIERQLSESAHGIAYTDGTEKITQLNRPIENNLMTQVTYLIENLYSQMGITKEVLNGTASENVMNNYYNRTVDPIIEAICNEISRKFLSITAQTQNQRVLYFRNIFKTMSSSSIASMADIFTRNEILTSNEIRQIIGFKPSNDPNADRLINSNINKIDDFYQETSTKEYTNE